MEKKKVKFPWLCLVIVGGLLFSLIQIGFAKEDPVMRTQGVVNPGGNLKAGYLLINEMRVYLDSATQIMDYRGGIVPAAEIKPKKWVYLEVEKDPVRNIIKAKKIYLLPHYIRPEEKRQYAFMK